MNNPVSEVNYVSIKKGSKTDLALTQYLSSCEEKEYLYVTINDCCNFKLVQIRTFKEYSFFICKIFQEESNFNDLSELVRKRYRWIDKNSSIGAMELELLKNALKSEAGEDIKKLYEIQENDCFILIKTKIIGDSDILYEILLFSKMPAEDRNRLIQRKEIKKKQLVNKKMVFER